MFNLHSLSHIIQDQIHESAKCSGIIKGFGKCPTRLASDKSSNACSPELS